MKIKSYEKQYFAQLGAVMDKARMQELEAENLEQVFVAFRDAPYLDYLLSCKIYVALEDEKLMGFINQVRSNSSMLIQMHKVEG